jgi:predicted transcriptional regulator
MVLRTALFVVGAAALPLCATTAWAQSSGEPTSAATISLPPSLRARIDRLADSARVLGVPTDPLYLKAAEGLLKGADESRVLDAARRLLGELTAARRVLGPASSIGELVAGANAIHARVDPELLRNLRDVSAATAARSSLVMPLVVIADLVARRVTSDVAVASVKSLMGRGAPDEEFASLRTAVERDIAGGATPDLAMRTRTDFALKALASSAVPLPRRPAGPPEHP